MNAITKALSLKSIIYEINTEEMISKLEILEEGSDPTHVCIFARTNIQHVDPVTKSNHKLVSHKVASKQENKTVLAIVISSDSESEPCSPYNTEHCTDIFNPFHANIKSERIFDDVMDDPVDSVKASEKDTDLAEDEHDHSKDGNEYNLSENECSDDQEQDKEKAYEEKYNHKYTGINSESSDSCYQTSDTDSSDENIDNDIKTHSLPCLADTRADPEFHVGHGKLYVTDTEFLERCKMFSCQGTSIWY